jgi:signal transduction histidine kinase
MLWRTLLLATVVALTAVIRLRVLERRSDEQRQVAQEAEEQLRLLSHQIVSAQEEERKNLSRELHDHVGQMLTALRMELGRIDRLRTADERVAHAVSESRQLVDNMVRTVRDLALGLRPSMLDDFGLQPALEWHVRDFTRRYGVPVKLDVSGDLASLPDQHRTCVYRVIQEALTNCVRHASASHVSVRVNGTDHRLEVAISDDGVGLQPERRRAGLGLRGIEERVRDLRGTLHIQSAPGRGTTVLIRLPIPQPAHTEATLARAAG